MGPGRDVVRTALDRARATCAAVLRRRGLVLRRLPPAALLSPLAVDLTIAATFVATTRGSGFIQIGAFDGMTNDPIRQLVVDHGWTGVLIEPQRAMFERLRRSYSQCPRLVFLNAAIAAESGSTTLWKVRDDAGAPAWTAQLASFDRDLVHAHLRPWPDLQGAVVGERVETITLDDAFDRAPAPVELVQIDAEGFDGEIIRMLDLERHRPAIIRFEHRHLGRREHDAAIRKLVAHGYRIAVAEDDTLALRYEPGAGTTATI